MLGIFLLFFASCVPIWAQAVPGGILILNNTDTTKQGQLFNGNWYSYAVPSFRPLDAGGNGILDVMSNGSTPSNRIQSWIHVCSTDITLSAVNWECNELRIYPTYTAIGSAALGTGVIRPLAVNEFGGNVNVGCSGTFPDQLHVCGNLSFSGLINGMVLPSGAGFLTYPVQTNTPGLASLTNPGFIAPLDGNSSHFLNGAGQWTTPTGIGGAGCIPTGPRGGLLTDSGSGTCNTSPVGASNQVWHGNGAGYGSVSGADAPTLSRRVCDIAIGDTSSGTPLVTAQLGPQKRICFIPSAATIIEVDVDSDNGVPSALIGVNHHGVTTQILSQALATAASGQPACANLTGVTGLDGVTTCSAMLENTSVLQGDYLELIDGTADGVANFITVHVTYTVN
jgi:hypothetical protein